VRSSVKRYHSYCDALAAHVGAFILPEGNYHLIFYLPVPRSFSASKKAALHLTPHQSRPDKDNLEKAFLDALLAEDCRVWDGRVTKLWIDAEQGMIEIYRIEETCGQE
jgi:Holliday junction resolvase RusA-like endonuclease